MSNNLTKIKQQISMTSAEEPWTSGQMEKNCERSWVRILTPDTRRNVIKLKEITNQIKQAKWGTSKYFNK